MGLTEKTQHCWETLTLLQQQPRVQVGYPYLGHLILLGQEIRYEVRTSKFRHQCGSLVQSVEIHSVQLMNLEIINLSKARVQ